MNRRDFNVMAGLAAVLGVSRAQAAAPARTVLVLGDSLSAEYGLRRGTGWVGHMEKWLVSQGLARRVVNASVSGDTTSGGRSRLPALLAEHQPTLVIIELGGNDALRGLPLKLTEDNLAWMARTARTAGARVLLLGMQMPPNYGRNYAERFAGTYTRVAKAEKAALVPFLLRGVADDDDPTRLFQADRIHPNEAAQPIMAANVTPALPALLK